MCIRDSTEFGAFVEITEEIDGLVHVSDMSWTKRIKHPSEFCNVGDSVEVMVLEVDKENRRLSLGHKQVEENPWEVFATVFTPGSTHEGTITGRAGQNFVVSLPYGVEGTVTIKHLKKADGSKAEVEEKLPFVVLEFNAEARRIVLSHTRTFEEGEEVMESAPAAGKRAPRKDAGAGPSASVKSVNDKVEKSTLGDLSVLSDLKSSMESTSRQRATAASASASSTSFCVSLRRGSGTDAQTWSKVGSMSIVSFAHGSTASTALAMRMPMSSRCVRPSKSHIRFWASQPIVMLGLAGAWSPAGLHCGSTNSLSPRRLRSSTRVWCQ